MSGEHEGGGERVKSSLYELAGGESKLRAVIEDFYEVVFGDAMIGFFFKGKDKAELVRLELEFVMRFLGAGTAYTGRPLREAHQMHPIMGGQFNRRREILKEAMARHELPEVVRRAWIEHTESLRSLVTPNAAGECKPAPRDASGA